ncbi:unnamed protein product, partial [Brassica rapa subsp. trilocularis]
WVDSPIEAKPSRRRTPRATTCLISFREEVTSEIRHRQRQFGEEPPMQRSIAETKRNRIIDSEKISPSSIDPSDSDEEPPLLRDKNRTIIGGCNAGDKAGQKHQNWIPKQKTSDSLIFLTNFEIF